MEFRLVLNQSENVNYNLILIVVLDIPMVLNICEKCNVRKINDINQIISILK